MIKIDMVEMECSEYGDRCYTMALIVTDLYSHFVFGRALAEAPDTSLLVRHLMDIFGAFAPPGKHISEKWFFLFFLFSDFSDCSDIFLHL